MKSVVLKISGELFRPCSDDACLDSSIATSIITQIKQLSSTHYFSIVVGGGNFFRGCKEGKELGLNRMTADNVGMLATVMNGLMLRDLFAKAGVRCQLLSAFSVAGIAEKVDAQLIEQAKQKGNILIFVGGTGEPFFSTDTTALVRALQVGASEVWKATKVDYVYDSNPTENKEAKALLSATYTDILERQLKIMDLTAIALAQEHSMKLRVFNLFKPAALIEVAQNPDFGSTIQ